MNSYAINCTPNYYAGDIHGNDKQHLVREPGGTVITVATEAEAQTIIAMLTDRNGAPYVLAHNQYAPPEYKAVPRTSSTPMRLVDAMRALDLHYDFAPDGTRLAGAGRA